MKATGLPPSLSLIKPKLRSMGRTLIWPGIPLAFHAALRTAAPLENFQHWHPIGQIQGIGIEISVVTACGAADLNQLPITHQVSNGNRSRRRLRHDRNIQRTYATVDCYGLD